ncbi:unnamed protein product, partial [Musa banksii]
MASHDPPLRGLGDEWQPRNLPQEACRGAVDERREQEQEDGAVEALEELQPDPAIGVEGPLEEIREYEEDVEDDGLHGVETDEEAEFGWIANDGEVEGEEEEGGGERGGAEEVDGRYKGLEDKLQGRELGQHEAPVVDAVEEGVEIAGGGQDAVRGVGGFAVLGGAGNERVEEAAATPGRDAGEPIEVATVVVEEERRGFGGEEEKRRRSHSLLLRPVISWVS